MLKLSNSKGFTLIELMVVIVVIGILGGVAIPRFMGAQTRARIAAAESDINSMRETLGLYEIDHASYVLGSINSYVELRSALVDSSGNSYMSLPDTSNFSWVSYWGDDTTYILQINARDNNATTLTGTPQGVTR